MGEKLNEYVPSATILEAYARVLVRFALGSGEGIKKEEVVFLEVPECAKPLLIALQKEVLRAGGHYITHYLPDDVARHFYDLAEEHHLDFFPEQYMKGKVSQADHRLVILAETNKRELEGIHPSKIIRKSKAQKPYREWLEEKENKGKFTWTLALYGTSSAAAEAGLTLEEYWEQIIRACYLDYPDPVSKWKESFVEIKRLQDALNALDIVKLRVNSQHADLTIGIGKNRRWLGGSGRNIPSFELFISPDWRMTEGKILFDQPLYRYGNLIEGISLTFKNGVVVEARAKKGEDILREMISVESADKIGEFSLTDMRLSRITKFMAETLFDENFGGKYGNTHVALGSAYKDSFPGDAASVRKEQWASMGYNESVVHTDIISTEDRVVTAQLADGSERVIYRQGKFTL